MFFMVIPTLVPFLSADEHVLTTLTLVYLGGNMLGRALPQFIDLQKMWPATTLQALSLIVLLCNAIATKPLFNEWFLLPVRFIVFFFFFLMRFNNFFSVCIGIGSWKWIYFDNCFFGCRKQM
jgi:hypothetical protein